MADNLAKGSKELEGKGGTLKDGKKLTIRKGSEEGSKTIEQDTPKVSTNKVNEKGKGSGNR